MKNILKLSFVALISFLLFSCTKNGEMEMLTTATPSTLMSSKSAVVLSKDDASKEAIKFTWTNPTSGPSLSFNNQLQFALKGTKFANPKSVDLPKGQNSVAYTVQDFNAVMLNLGLPVDGSTSDLEVRVKSTLFSLESTPNNLPAPSYSPVLNLSVKPYALISYLYAVGAFQGFDINNAQTLVSATSNGIYIGFLNFTKPDSGFLIVPMKGTYDNKFGSNDNFHLISGGGNDLKAANSGYQKITVDTNALTFVLAPYAMGIAGSATPGQWDEGAADIPMTWDYVNSVWTATATFTKGEIKFRTNKKWAENYGGANGVVGGDNIAVTAGVHTVTLDLNKNMYTIN